MTESVREKLAKDIELVLADIRDPQIVKVTREPFAVEELAITQFPAILVSTGLETRETVSMHTAGIRQGMITYDLRAFVRGNQLDTKRNAIIEAIEEQLDSDRYRDQTGSVVLNSQITNIEVIDRQPPLAEVLITFEVDYVFTRGTT